MNASLLAFCSRQFLAHRFTNACEFVLEALTSDYLIPAARSHSIENPGVRYTLSVAEGDTSAEITVDHSKLIEQGLSGPEILDQADEIAANLTNSMTSGHEFVSDGVQRMRVGWPDNSKS